ncbi:hypothetical protein HK097_009343 [Rhizophlyctis rosea]|uniref:NADP-dependent oxidoreductase domain-containing protein n=1 Tax=Rhizophlyctis rosea TaxID=64517 RepID=A0AAD5SJ60_9FUNG|nr:hypothetical protein HK097_009343 [Rhizophlyctis rosea]
MPPAVPSLPLPSGGSIPIVGLGVWQANAKDTVKAVGWALQAGYRHIDTAALYRNEQQVGEAIRNSSIPRSEIFVTTKVWNSDQGYESTLKAFETSLRKLNMEYVDLYLIHSPVKETRRDTWRALEKLKHDGKVNFIGVSNYNIHHLEELKTYAEQLPDVNQFEVTPYHQRRELVQYCQQNGIIVEAYSPLTQGEKLRDPPLVKIAEKLGKSTAQILIKWGLQKGFVSLPKSVHETRIKENLDMSGWEIPEKEMGILDGFDEEFVAGG